VQITRGIEGRDQSSNFVHDFSNPSDRHGASSLFDEPLASAISADLDYNRTSPPVLPMYPNGVPGSGSLPKTYSVPIRSMAAGISDGMSEGFGRLRREMGRVRSPRLVAQPDGPVPLEFDEMDDDFATSSGGQDAPIQGAEEEDVAWKGWEAEDRPVIEEAERFDDLVVGFMDEEQAPQQAEKALSKKSKRKKH
jgi:hypothetical protein